jgi:hypothetical protein
LTNAPFEVVEVHRFGEVGFIALPLRAASIGWKMWT